MAATARPTRPARLENGRRDLTDIAIDCFARFGYQATTIDRIAKAAGLTKGAIYYHFKDKEDLLFAAVKDRVSQFENRVTKDVLPVEDPVAALRGVTDLCLEHATKSNHRRFIVTLMVEALDTNARLSAQFRRMMERFRLFLRGIIEVGQQRGLFRADLDAATAATVFAGAVMGAEIEYYQDPKSVDLENTLRTFLDQYLTWLRVAARRAAPGR
jgi:AcrR family transcriptional regulator